MKLCNTPFPMQLVAITDTLHAWNKGTYPIFTVGQMGGKTMFLSLLAEYLKTHPQFNWIKKIYYISHSKRFSEFVVRMANNAYEEKLLTVMSYQTLHKLAVSLQETSSRLSVTEQALDLKDSIILIDGFYTMSPALMETPALLMKAGCRHICVTGDNYRDGPLWHSELADQYRYAAWDWNPIISEESIERILRYDFHSGAAAIGLWDSRDVERRLKYIRQFAPHEIRSTYDMFYDSLETPVTVEKPTVGRVANL